MLPQGRSHPLWFPKHFPCSILWRIVIQAQKSHLEAVIYWLPRLRIPHQLQLAPGMRQASQWQSRREKRNKCRDKALLLRARRGGERHSTSLRAQISPGRENPALQGFPIPGLGMGGTQIKSLRGDKYPKPSWFHMSPTMTCVVFMRQK